VFLPRRQAGSATRHWCVGAAPFGPPGRRNTTESERWWTRFSRQAALMSGTGRPPTNESGSSDNRWLLKLGSGGARHEVDRRRTRPSRQHTVENASSVPVVFGPVSCIDLVVQVMVGRHEGDI